MSWSSLLYNKLKLTGSKLINCNFSTIYLHPVCVLPNTSTMIQQLKFGGWQTDGPCQVEDKNRTWIKIDNAKPCSHFPKQIKFKGFIHGHQTLAASLEFVFRSVSFHLMEKTSESQPATCLVDSRDVNSETFHTNWHCKSKPSVQVGFRSVADLTAPCTNGQAGRTDSACLVMSYLNFYHAYSPRGQPQYSW